MSPAETKEDENKIIKSIHMDENNEDENKDDENMAPAETKEDENKIIKSTPMTPVETENNENLEISKPLPKEPIVKGSEAIMKYTLKNTENSPNILGLTKGTVVKVISLKDETWALVKADGKKGYVPRSWLEVHN